MAADVFFVFGDIGINPLVLFAFRLSVKSLNPVTVFVVVTVDPYPTFLVDLCTGVGVSVGGEAHERCTRHGEEHDDKSLDVHRVAPERSGLCRQQ